MGKKSLLILACIVLTACSLFKQAPPAGIPVSGSISEATRALTVTVSVTATVASTRTARPVTRTPTVEGATHKLLPSNSPPRGLLILDAQSSGTALEKRAPNGDSYSINLFERPFLKDMSYVPDLDIAGYSLSSDRDWYYVSIALVGKDPNNKLGILYGIEIDLNADGYGDILIQGSPPFTEDWSTSGVRVLKDTNHDTGGSSSIRTDAPFNGDGYETMIFNGGAGDDDPDLAWVRMNAGPTARVEFAFKKSLADARFMLGVLADAGLKDAGRMDYNDCFTASEAGSPLRNSPNYPLKALFAVDNVCRQGVGFILAGNEPQGCPADSTVRRTPNPGIITVPTTTLTLVPISTDAPTATDQPTATSQPLPTDPPTATSQPLPTDPPTATEPPIPTDIPPPTVCPPPPGCINWDPVACECLD